MTAATAIPFPQTVEECLKAFLKDLQEFSGYGSQRPGDAFREWTRMAAVPIMSATARLACDDAAYKRYEEEYARIEKRRKAYCPNAVEVGGRMFAYVSTALTLSRRDFLGTCMERELMATNNKHGQVFTPPHIAHFMARVLSKAASVERDEAGLVTVCEPACGTGVITIEGLESLVADGVPQQDIWFECEDIDEGAANCCYIQLSLLGYAGVVRTGNTLSGEYRENAFTPGGFLLGTVWRRARAMKAWKKVPSAPAGAEEAQEAPTPSPATEDAPAADVAPMEEEPTGPVQMEMFPGAGLPQKAEQLELFGDV